MQYAEVVVNTKTISGNDVFTYSISPADLPKIKAGVLVSVPFHGRTLDGIIIGLKKSLPAKISAEKIKKIKSILDPEPVIDDIHLELAKWMSEYYLASLGETLFANLVPVAKRQLKTDNSQLTVNKNSFPIPHFPKPILIHADFETRFKYYLKAIRQAIGDKRQVIIIVPDLSFLEYFQKYLPKNKIIVLSSEMTLTERYLAWREIKEKNIPIILGSTSALFAPCKNLDLVVIDQEESSFYKSEQSPLWHLPKVAQKLCEFANAQLILGSITPSIESYYQAKKSKIKLIKKTIQKIPTKLIDLSHQKQIISYELEEAIGAIFKKNGKVILYVNRKKEGRILTCPDCNHNFLCSQCLTPLIPNENKLICFHCTSVTKFPTKCPHCQNINLKVIGITTDRVKHLLETIFPNKKILILEKETAEFFKLDKITLDKILKEADIIVGTFYLTKSALPKADLIGIVCADQSLSLPDFRIQERTFSHLLQILRLGKSAIVQTFIPDHAVMKALANNSYEQFYDHEIKDRSQFGYPPFSKLIRFIYQNPSEEKCQKESQKLSRTIKYQIAKDKIPAKILGPSSAFYKKIRGEFRYHFILKSKINWKPEISKLAKGWIIDVDPMNML
jgi:primosomal protein N' (replication factor Y)